MANHKSLVALIFLVGCVFDSPAPDGTPGMALVDFGNGPSEVSYVVEDGQAVVGDMVLGEVDAFGDIDSDETWESYSYLRVMPWPSGRIPYEIAPSLSAMSSWAAGQAVATWNATGLVDLVPATASDPNILRFQPSSSVCSSCARADVGFDPNDPVRVINMGGTVEGLVATHEVGHTIGLLHEHQRPDRETYIDVHPSLTGNRDFDIINSGVIHRPYDYNSIMHYPSFNSAPNPWTPSIVLDGCSFTNPAPSCQILGSTVPTHDDERGVLYVQSGDSTQLQNDMNNLCMRPSGGSMSSGAAVVTASCNNSRSRNWYFYPRSNNEFWVVNQNSRMCLTAPSSGWNMVQTPCNDSSNQRFDKVPSAYGGHQLRKAGTTRCVRRVESQSTLILSSRCNDTVSRRWFSI